MFIANLLLAAALVPMPRNVEWRTGTTPIAPPTFVEDAAVPPEGYRLSVGEKGVVVTASSAAGRFYAEKTLEQLAENGRYPRCEIEDAPAYPWRGFMLDEVRHFFGKALVLRLLDEMSRLKMNRFHWHLTDDQGWRIQLKKYPELTEYGATRPSSPVRGVKWQRESDKTQYGPFFYTEEDVREIVAYAAARHITIVPEIDVPGHCQGLLAGYPWMLCEGETLKPRAARGNWWLAGIRTLCIGNDEAIRQVEGIFDELIRIFPGEYVHIGGDECPDRYWAKCPKCQARMKAEGMKGTYQLQGWFSRHMANHLASRGRKAIGWDEILGGGPPKDCAIMSWRGANGGIAAAKAGHCVVMTPSHYCYMGHWDGNPVLSPLADGAGPQAGSGQTADLIYGYDPAAGVPEAARKFILGGQGSVWTEFIFTPEEVEYRFFPRVGALAEVLWTAPEKRDYRAFRKRLEVIRAGQLARGIHAAGIFDLPKLAVAGDWRVSLEWGADLVAFDVPPAPAAGTERLDAVVRRADGTCEYRLGTAVAQLPPLPKLAEGERLAGTVWVTAGTAKLTEDALYPAPAARLGRRQCLWNEPLARDACPKTVKKLQNGGKLRILFWGDESVEQTALRPEDRWTTRFGRRLKEIYPKANVEFVTHAWRGATTHAFLGEKPGSAHNFAEQVLAAKPDLVISAFANDAAWPEGGFAAALKHAETTVLADYGAIHKAFRENKIEWVVCLPHYALPAQMGVASPKELKGDPRPYCKVLSRFLNKNRGAFALAETAKYWGAQLKLGIPYPVLLGGDGDLASPEGAKYYAWALDDLFRNGEPAPETGPLTGVTAVPDNNDPIPCEQVDLSRLKANIETGWDGKTSLRCGTPVAVRLSFAQDGRPVALKGVKLRIDDWKTTLSAKTADVPADGLALDAATLEKPGFLRFVVTVGKSQFMRSVPFEYERLEKGSPTPADFRSYWQGEIAKLEADGADEPTMVPVTTYGPKFDAWRVSFATAGGKRVYGVLTVPKDRAKGPFPVRVSMPSAGQPTPTYPASWLYTHYPEPDAVSMTIFAHCDEIDLKEVRDAYFARIRREHSEKYGVDYYPLAGISESREAYHFHPVFLGAVRAVKWLHRQPYVDKTRFTYQGASQGGYFGIVLAGLTPCFTKVVAIVPAGTDTMGCLAGRLSGWPRILERQLPANRAAAEKWAPYFDGANFAGSVTCPIRFVCGCIDTTCPPTCVCAAFNALASKDKEILFMPGHGHGAGGPAVAAAASWRVK